MPKETRSKARKATNTVVPGTENPSDATVVTEETDDVERLAIAVNKDGTIAYDRMRENTRERVRALFGGAASSAVALPVEVASETVRMLNNVITAAVGIATKAPKEIVHECTTFSDDQRKRLEAPTHELLNKYAGPAIMKWSVEMNFGLALFNVTQEMIGAVNARVAATNATEPAKDAA